MIKILLALALMLAPVHATPRSDFELVAYLYVRPLNLGIFNGAGAAAGTAFFVGPRLAITAYHVVDDPIILNIQTTSLDGGKRHWKVLAINKAQDMALLGLVSGPPVTTFVAPTKALPALGDTVCTISAYPHLRKICGEVQPSKPGTVVFNGMVTPGNSGSPLFFNGQIVGVTVAMLTCHGAPCLGVANLF